MFVVYGVCSYLGLVSNCFRCRAYSLSGRRNLDDDIGRVIRVLFPDNSNLETVQQSSS